MKKLILFACLIGLGSISAQEQSKKAVVRIKKVENINGVETVKDTTYTIDNPENMTFTDGDDHEMKILIKDGDVEIEGDEKPCTKKIVIKKDGNDESEDVQKWVSEESIQAEVDKVMKEMGIEEGKGEKKVIIIKSDVSSENGESKKEVIKIITHKVNITDANAKEAKKAGITGLSNTNLEIDQLSFYPNPNNGKFQLKFNLKKQGDLNVNVVDVNGKEVYKETIKQFKGDYNKTIDLGEEAKGIYFVKVQQDQQAQVKKIIVE
ncbi:MAG: T9SS type A sorting domain-containing protein [Bacteroidia bacterium]